MEIETDFRSRLHQTSRVRWKYIGVFAERVLIEESSLGGHSSIGWRIVVVFHRGHDVVNDFETLCGFGFDRLNVSVFSETWIHLNINPAVGRLLGDDNIFR